MSGHVITFYSYKGGTGRTMALANVAVELARDRGARVLAIDWDLEAPGLHRFLNDGDDERPGLIELFASASDQLGSAPVDEHDVSKLWRAAPLGEFIGETAIPRLSVMRAGRMDASYPTRVNALDWERLYHHAPDLFSSFAEVLAERYDYVLVDSRTGITDAGGICTMLMPDRLVLVFTPNRQSLDGVVDLVRKATDYRSRSDDLRPLVAFPLASRVELSEEELRHEWRYGTANGSPASGTSRAESSREGYQPRFERVFRTLYDLPGCDLDAYFDEVQIQHAARFAYGEQIAILDETASDRLSLARSYASFTRVLTDGSPPWEVAAPSIEQRVEHAEPVLTEIAETTHLLSFKAHRLRRVELLTRLFQVVLTLATFVSVMSLSLNTYYGASSWGPIVAGGAAFIGLAEVLMRTLAPPASRLALAGGAAAMARERRLFDACAGPYAHAHSPVALLAERIDEILADVERAAPGAGGT